MTSGLSLIFVQVWPSWMFNSLYFNVFIVITHFNIDLFATCCIICGMNCNIVVSCECNSKLRYFLLIIFIFNNIQQHTLPHRIDILVAYYTCASYSTSLLVTPHFNVVVYLVLYWILYWQHSILSYAVRSMYWHVVQVFVGATSVQLVCLIKTSF